MSTPEKRAILINLLVISVSSFHNTFWKSKRFLTPFAPPPTPTPPLLIAHWSLAGSSSTARGSRFLPLKQPVDHLAEGRDGLGTPDGGRLDRAVLGGLADEKGGCPGDPDGRAGSQVFADGGGILALVQTAVEVVDLQTQIAGKPPQIVDHEGALVLEEPGMHLPVLALLAGAMGGLGGLPRLGMDRVQGEIAEDVSDLAGVDVVLLERRQRVGEVPLAERALVVG